jgi:phosphoglycolate phosphatase-like HAD superfamily hydrolase
VTPRPATGLIEIAARCRHVLLDFDGPVCAVFAGTAAPDAARELRLALSAAGVSLPGEVLDIDDPLEVFRVTARHHPEAGEVANQELTRLEFQAVIGARPTKGAADLIATARRTGRTVTIVTNNSSDAAMYYLDIHGLHQHGVQVVGRDDADPERMKPSPYRVREAVSMAEAEGDECAFIGDSVSDMLAGRLAGVAVIGFANKPHKVSTLTRAGADAVTTRLSEISAALRAAPSPALPN